MKIVKGETYIVRWAGEDIKVKMTRIYEENGEIRLSFECGGASFTEHATNFRQRVEQAAIIPLKELDEVEI